MQIVKRYEADQVSEICTLFGKLVLLLDSEPQDVLGQALYDSRTWQYAGRAILYTA